MRGVLAELRSTFVDIWRGFCEVLGDPDILAPLAVVYAVCVVLVLVAAVAS